MATSKPEVLHLVADIGKPGIRDKEKRHFPDLQNRPGKQKFKQQGRLYIGHGRGEDYQFRPHNSKIEPKYTDNGLDWTSKMRYIPPPKEGKPPPELWPDSWKSLRTFSGPQKSGEWVLYPEGEGYDVTLRCEFDGVHKRSQVTAAEITDALRFGRSKAVIDKRNGLPLNVPGDKSYKTVEYSPEFYKYGVSIPVVPFGRQKVIKDSALILLPVQHSATTSYATKEKERKAIMEIDEVAKIETWKPATPLEQTVPPWKQLAEEKNIQPKVLEKYFVNLFKIKPGKHTVDEYRSFSPARKSPHKTPVVKI